MAYNTNFQIANSEQIEKEICLRVEKIRLSRNISQEQLAAESGVSLRTVGRLEKGQGVSFDTFLRVLIALGIQQNLDALLPDPGIRPVERVKSKGRERKRARPSSKTPKTKWIWGDEIKDNE